MKKKRASIGPTATITLAVAGLLILDVAWAFARKGNLPAPKKHEWNYAALANAPEKARSKPNPFERDPNAVAAGGKLFQQHCAECHGREGEGGERGPGLRGSNVQDAPAGAIFWVLSNGVVRQGMPDWSKLPDPERWQLVTFLKSLSEPPKSPHGRASKPGRPSSHAAEFPSP